MCVCMCAHMCVCVCVTFTFYCQKAVVFSKRDVWLFGIQHFKLCRLCSFPVDMTWLNSHGYDPLSNVYILSLVLNLMHFVLCYVCLCKFIGDITAQGFEKKKAKLLAPYLSSGGCCDVCVRSVSLSVCSCSDNSMQANTHSVCIVIVYMCMSWVFDTSIVKDAY